MPLEHDVEGFEKTTSSKLAEQLSNAVVIVILVSSCFAVHEVIVHDNTSAIAAIGAEIDGLIVGVVYASNFFVGVGVVVIISFSVCGVATS